MRSLRSVDLNMLRNLYALLVEKHVARAATLLGVTPSAMSHNLRRLRDYFQDPLLVKVEGQYELTPLAAQLEDKLHEFMAGAENIVETGVFNPSKIATKFRIEAPEFIIVGSLAPAIKRMQAVAPNLVFQLHTFSDKCQDRLIQNEIDLLFGSELVSHPRLMSRLFCEERPVYVLDENHPCLEDWTAENLFSYPHIGHPDADLSSKLSPLSKWCAENNFCRLVTLEASNPYIRHEFLKGSNLIDAQIESQARLTSDVPGLKIMPPPFDMPKHKINMFWTERNHKDNAHAWIREQFTK